MRTLAIDIETYSSVSLQKCGVYAYAQSPDFEILLFGYAWDDGPVEVIDLARGESLPEELQNALYDPEILKTAFNASFERTCLSAFMGRVTPPEQWSCTAVMARELGLPGSLEAVGEVIGLPEDKQKSKTGRALIRYFSIPCKPTKTNGNRTRNLPEHDPDRWAIYVEYNRQDVVSERAMVIIDELSSFKSSKAQRFRALKKVRKYIKRIVGLTGTPSPNGLLDLWPEMYLLDEGKALGKTLTGYRDTYFVPDKRNATTIFSWKLKDGAEELIYEKIGKLCISMNAADYLQLPDRLFLRREFELTPEAMELYKTLERDTLLPFADGDIDAPTAAVLTNKLLQAAGGAAYDENGNVKVLHDCKLEALDQLIEEANGQPVLVFYAFRHERDRIMERYPEAVDIKDDGAVVRWNEGKIPIMLAHPASAGHGLNLQAGGHIAIWYGLPTSLELYQQANKRLHRPGQKKTVLIHHILMKDTYDYRVLDDILAPKEVRQNACLEALKARIKEVSK